MSAARHCVAAPCDKTRRDEPRCGFKTHAVPTRPIRDYDDGMTIIINMKMASRDGQWRRVECIKIKKRYKKKGDVKRRIAQQE